MAGVTFELQGHRGARGLRPENTLPGFVHAFEMGVDGVELDVGFTLDGVVVLHHDQALSEIICGAGPYVGVPIRELTLEQVKTVDAGVRTAGDVDPYLFTQLPIPGTPIPTLAEVCALAVRCEPRPVLAIELKTDPSWTDAEVELFVAEVARVVRSYGLEAHARLLGFDWRVITGALRTAPRLGRVALVEQKTIVPGTGWLAGFGGEDWIASAVAAGATMISPEDVLTTAESVTDAHSLGLPVSVWTVNEPDEMARFLDLGVDAIVTDYPDRLRAVLESRGLALPRPGMVRRADRVG